jgi:acyl-coenzyme A thioesterase PaaI-like protein
MTGRDLNSDARAHFMSTMGFSYDMDEHRATGRAAMGPYLRSSVRWPGVSALLTFADVLIGQLASLRTAPRISVTSDMWVRVLRPFADGGEISMSAELLKSGRTMSVGETRFFSEAHDLLAVAVGTFLASPRPVDEAPEGFSEAVWRPGAEVAPTLVEQVGLRVLAPGQVELALRPDLVNATESLQGGLVALLGEVAAAGAATEATGRPHVVEDLQVRYLAAARIGPFRTSVDIHLDGPAPLVRVEVRDPGRDDRLAALILADTRPDPASA